MKRLGKENAHETYEVNKWTAKAKENEKKKEEVLKKERKVNQENINKMNIKMGTWNVRRLKGKETKS
jgi:hypothetical protein